VSDTPTFSLIGPLPAGRVAVEASAGTGKTYTLAGLVVRYVAEAAIPIDEILVVTFTRAAAAELRDRVRARLTEAVAALRNPPGTSEDPLLAFLGETDRTERLDRLENAVVGFDAATITTIHSFAQQILATLGSTSPSDLDATLVNDTDELVATVCADFLSAESVARPADTAELPKLDKLRGLVTKVLGNPGIRVIPSPVAADSTPGAARRRQLVDQVVDEVHRRRRVAGTLSFDDLLTQLRDALQESTAVAATLRRRFRVALIDEFQDTDPVQWDLFATLFGDTRDDSTLVLVGDPKQSIYAFRGANVHTYLGAVYDDRTDRSTLGTNWRSDKALLVGLEHLFTGATFGDRRIGFLPVEAAPAHQSGRLITAAGVNLPALRVRAAVDADIGRISAQQIAVPDASNAIAGDLAGQVQTLLETATIPSRGPHPMRPVRPGDIAVLIGTHAEAPAIQSALRRRAIPAVVLRGDTVMRSAAASHWRWFLTSLARPADPTRARTAAFSWFFGWTIAQIDEADDAALSSVHDQLFRWAEALDSHGIIEFCARVWAESGVAARVLALPDGDRDLTDLDHVAALLQAHTTGHRPSAVSLLATLDQLTAAKPSDPEEDVTARHVESESEAVQIMTVYAAKGLEFPVVCVPGLWRDKKVGDVIFRDPSDDIRTFDIANDEKWPTKGEAATRKEFAASEAIGESLRLLYVALTRAEHQTLVWWTHAKGSEKTGLARLLFARDGATIDPDQFSSPKVALPAHADTRAALEATFASAGDTVDVTITGSAKGPIVRWDDQATPAPSPSLELATLGRELARTNRRWSFTAISGRGHTAALDPADESLGDAGAADEPVLTDESISEGPSPELSDLPLGAVPGGPQFGTLVHEVLEQVDFTAVDLDVELRNQIGARLRWNPWPVDETTLVAGLRAAIETPLGPLFAGQRLRDLAPTVYLSELTFELPLGGSLHTATDSDIGALVLRHLVTDHPLRPWAESLAGGLFHVDLAGHLTGSIDLIVRVDDPANGKSGSRFVVVDYKTNKLASPGRESQSADYVQARLPAAMVEHHYPLQALLYSVALHRYLRWRMTDYDPTKHLGGAAYLFVRGMIGADTPIVDGHPNGVHSWPIPPALVCDLSDLLDGRSVTP
jgi:exodeoxyribonuclease V beta subunit